MPQPRKTPQLLRPEAALGGILALLVDERETRNGEAARKTEVVLADAGLNSEEIATVTGKSPEAVRKAIERARKRN